MDLLQTKDQINIKTNTKTAVCPQFIKSSCIICAPYKSYAKNKNLYPIQHHSHGGPIASPKVEEGSRAPWIFRLLVSVPLNK